MNIMKREWADYAKHTIYWSIGVCLLIIITFYKVSGMMSTPGGIEGMLDVLPAPLQYFFGAGVQDYTSPTGSYGMIHLYLLIALSLHAIMLGASIFAKEEHDKTFEFLYVKGMKRTKILKDKIIAGFGILLFLNIVCLITATASIYFINEQFAMLDILPFLISMLIAQCFFFTLALTFSFLLPNNKKAGMVGSCIVLVMFLVSFYVKLSGSMDFLNYFTVFYYLDASIIQKEGIPLFASVLLLLLSIGGMILSFRLHDKRDLL